jgi:hypothetical protein
MPPHKEDRDSLEYQLVRAELEKLKSGSGYRIKFSKHALDQLNFREIPKEDAVACLNNPDNLIKVDRQDGGRFKNWFKISGRYCLVIVTRFNRDSMTIITVYKTSRKWQQQIKPRIKRT